MLLLLSLCRPVAVAAAEALHIAALDVGEGQSILLQRGKHGVLVDTGHAGEATAVLARLRAHGVDELDYLVLTHLHPDHASGYFRIREAFPDAIVLDHQRPRPVKGPDMSRWIAQALARDPNRRRLRAGDVIRWQDVELRALWPRGEPGPDMNRDSLVLQVTHGGHKALLMGDVGTGVEERLLEGTHLRGPYDILVAGHHGSEGTSSTPFLKEVQPAYTIISIDADNIRGYPAPETVARLRRHTREQLLTTYEDGEICLELGQPEHAPRPCS